MGLKEKAKTLQVGLKTSRAVLPKQKNKLKQKMFFFFAGGVEQQVRQVLRSGAGRCIACKSPADLVEYEKVLKLFFVPVWRWPGKEPVMHCNNCKLFFPKAAEEELLRCRFCDRKVETDFSFCPYCGSAMSNQGF